MTEKIFKEPYIHPEQPEPVAPAETQKYTTEREVPAEGVFKIGESVVVGRTVRDEKGQVIKGQFTPESGWKVTDINDEAGTITVLSPDGTSEKSYSSDRLRLFNPLSSETREHHGEITPTEAREMGEEALDAAEVPNPWSREAAESRRRKAAPTREHPLMFNLETATRVYRFPMGNGRMSEGTVAGVFTDATGENIALIEPSSEYRRQIGFQGQYVEVPVTRLELKTTRTVENTTVDEHAEAAKKMITADDIPEAQ